VSYDATIAQLVEAAYREGFQSGADHGNIGYKYPPEDIAWRVSDARQRLTGEFWKIDHRYDWTTKPDDPGACCVKDPRI
jgi:hypothetical protein